MFLDVSPSDRPGERAELSFIPSCLPKLVPEPPSGDGWMHEITRDGYLDPDQCAAVLAAPLRREPQPDGRTRHYGRVRDGRDGSRRILRVVTLDDGETVHNAFFDRNFQEDQV